ncbi:MAG: hypothetical protein CMN30_24635 [Sandaracinus sp.]|nr:hypothetical protein [Sandaracinus sp.]
MKTKTLWILAALALGCGTDDETGVLEVRLSGEEASREGYPVGTGDDVIAFADGYTLTFDRVLVSVVNLELRDGDDVADLAVDPVVADLHLGEPTAWTFDAVPARRWREVRYDYGVPPADARLLDGVDASDVDRMRAAGASLLVAGSASDGTATIPFELLLPTEVANARCVNGVDDTDGLVVPGGAVTEAELTVHLDHLFFDDYASEEPDLRFAPWAAVAGDEAITLADLDTQSLADLRDADGEPLTADGERVVYDPGPLELESNTLGSFVRAAARTTGHFQGEGHCDYATP